MSQPNYYAIIPADVRYDPALRANAKLLYAEITALCSLEGFCWAENEYFAGLYGKDEKTVSRWVSQLRDRGYIGVEILQSEGNKRRITIDKKVTTPFRQKSHEVVTKKSRGSDKNVTPYKENNTINNTKNISAETPFDFLEKNHLSKLESALMKFKTKMPDFEKFKTYYNLRIVKDGTPWDAPRLIASMELMANTWLENLGRRNVTHQQQNTTAVAPVHGRIELKRRGA
jgi:hypothetical protein